MVEDKKVVVPEPAKQVQSAVEAPIVKPSVVEPKPVETASELLNDNLQESIDDLIELYDGRIK